MKQITFFGLVLSVLTFVPYIHLTPTFDYACDPRNAAFSCLLGCLGCFEVYGGQMYNMAACCQDCRTSGASMIDDGPVKCSNKYIKRAWMARFGK